jgi:hypothetical protein
VQYYIVKKGKLLQSKVGVFDRLAGFGEERMTTNTCSDN